MTDSSNVFINNFDNKPEFLTLIKSIIKKDDANRLLAVLNNLSQDATTLNTTDKDKCNEIESKLFGFEHTVLGYEDLLHLAVLYHASACIQILINPPYMWSPYYVNKNGESAMQLAEQQGCLKLQYIMAANSPENFFVTPEFSLRSVSSLLIYPQAFITEPFSYSELFTWNYYDVMPGRAVEYLNNRIIGPYRSVHNLSLLFELIIATPEICPTILSDINEVSTTLISLNIWIYQYT
uniref:ANK_REP_REGION domain-containing protein n=1 Tax=Schistosoma mansoni TaxID=6183 RepID=A0A3Q0KM07_SCHMA